MSVTDMFRVNELKAEIKRLSQELENTKREQDNLIKENSSLKAVLSDVEKMEYLELKKLTSELNSEKEKAKNVE